MILGHPLLPIDSKKTHKCSGVHHREYSPPEQPTPLPGLSLAKQAQERRRRYTRTYWFCLDCKAWHEDRCEPHKGAPGGPPTILRLKTIIAPNPALRHLCGALHYTSDVGVLWFCVHCKSWHATPCLEHLAKDDKA